MDPPPLAGQTALVTGGSRGIGRAIAARLATGGANVVVAARSRSEVERAAGEIAATGAETLGVAVDVTSTEEVEALARAALERFGAVDILVNNAGTHVAGRFADIPLAEWERCLDVNLMGAVRVTKAFLPGMVARGRGRIVNIASTAGKWASPNQSPYNASKHALIGLTRCLALETAAQGVRVNAICPGFVDTEMAAGIGDTLAPLLGIQPREVIPKLLERVPIGRLVTADEVADVAWLLAATPAGDAITGQAITIAGGLIFT